MSRPRRFGAITSLTIAASATGIISSSMAAQPQTMKQTLNTGITSSIEFSNPSIARTYFDNTFLSENFVLDLTQDTKRDLLYWSDCRAGIAAAENLNIPIVEPEATGCLYLVFGVLDSKVGDSYEKWVDYWLLDKPCTGTQSSGCYLGYVIDTRINNESTTRSVQYETTIESSHKFWSTQITSRRVEPANYSADVDDSSKLNQKSVRKNSSDKNRTKPTKETSPTNAEPSKAGQTQRITAKVATSRVEPINHSQTLDTLKNVRQLQYAGSMLIEQTLAASGRRDTKTTYLDADDILIGDPIYLSAIASSSVSADNSCEVIATDAGDVVGETVHSAVQGLTTLGGAFTGGSFGAAAGGLGGAAAGSATFGPGPGTVGGAVTGAVAGGTTGTAAGGTIGHVLGDYTGAAAGWLADAISTAVVGVGCEFTSDTTSSPGGPTSEVSTSPAGGSSSGGVVIVLDSETEEESEKDDEKEASDEKDENKDEDKDKDKDDKKD